MKKNTFSFITALVVSVFGLQAQSWSVDTCGYSLMPATANLGIGVTASIGMKLRLQQNDASNTGTLYGLYSYQTSSNASSTGSLYGAYLSNSKSNSNSSGTVFGIYSSNSNSGKTGSVYGLYSYNNNSNPTAGTVYGNYIYSYSANPNNPVYGVYASVSGAGTNTGTTTKKWSGYFNGGDLEVAGGGNVIVGNSVRIGRGIRRFILSPSWQTSDPALLFIAPIKTDESDWDWSKQIVLKNDGSIIMYAGNLGVGITNPTAKLDVAGTIRAHEVKVCLNQGCDYVFENDYNLMNLNDLSNFVKTNKHLPDVAPAAVMESEGINVSEMNALLLRKVEELTLYVIELKREIDALKNK